MCKILKNPAKIAMMHVGVIQRRDEHHMTTNQGLFLCFDGNSTPSQQPAAILDLLVEFSDLFEEPKTLPPRRDQDHAITLKPGSPPINVRPYRYPTLQENKIERMIQSMLESGVIRHSINPYSSPVRN
ncbi:hypothetical protein Salat_2764800 [Sesamum alatum]|uniref:Uncharacterized protein n=1 Tax=Sesamum alatum TaxID=300844 RepID=A0AAE2C925_9LAMI|nr:hypothetical protein Salat_2764800 [Sesamum alatum]